MNRDMKEDILNLAQEFVSIPSNPDNTEALATILNLALSKLSNFTIERFERNGATSALVYVGPVRPKKFKVLLNGHLDIIPGKPEQYTPVVKGKRLYGVGVMDMKANLASMLYAFAETAHKVSYPLGLQLVTDEELGGFDGTKYQVEQGVRADFVLTSEPTNFDIVYKARGIIWLKISSRGKTAHGAYPWRGENAIWTMHEFLAALKKQYPIPTKEKWVTTVNVAKIETNNQSLNKIPDDCTVSLDIRYIPEDTNVLQKIKKLLPKGFSMEVLTDEPALDTDSNNSYIQALQGVSSKILKKKITKRGAFGSSDARHFGRYKCPGIEFGPIGEGIGSDNEWVDIPSLEKFNTILTTFLLELDISSVPVKKR
ncbi:MAG: M20/M25/M40 family metallo-hydrolase [Candidatus Adlerbacteria bacterium]|nr:M20/M25/M40 family metallo-hydrolase [Candidatus Adlerbacteria bacterium]